MTAAIDLRRVSCGGPGQPGSLAGIDLSVPAGQVLALCGPAGAGKSTLLRLMAREVPPRSGAVCLFSRDIWLMSAEEAAGTVAWLNPAGSGFDRLTPRQVVGAARRAAPLAEVQSALQAAGLGSGRGPAFGRLSPARRMRVLTARALVLRPRILLMAGGAEALRLHLRLLSALDATFVLALEDAGQARALADRVVELDRRRILADSAGCPVG